MKKPSKGKSEEERLRSSYEAAMRDNAAAVLSSQRCGCPHCGISFPTGNITDWVEEKDGSMTALCPHCGFADVVAEDSGLDIGEESLRAVGKILFPRERSEAAENFKGAFLDLYDNGLLNESARNESLFLQYSNDFASQGLPYATSRIGMLFEFGSRFTKADPKVAFSYYASDHLRGDAFALARLGRCLERMNDRENNLSDAFKCYARSAALSNDYGKMYLGDCFLNGIGVEPDREAAAGIYMSLYHAVLRIFIQSKGENPHILPELALRIARLLREPSDDREYLYVALRYALIGQYALSFKRKDVFFKHYPLDSMEAEFRSIIDALAGELGAVGDAPYFDADCFLDTMDVFGDEGYLEQGPGRLSLKEAESEPGVYEAEISMTSGSMLVVDSQALYCGFHAGTTHWYFEGVKSLFGKKRKNILFLNVYSYQRRHIVFQSAEGEGHDLSIILDDDEEGKAPQGRKGEA